MDSDLPYATSRTVTDPADCYFYHTLEVPGYQTPHTRMRASVDRQLPALMARSGPVR